MQALLFYALSLIILIINYIPYLPEIVRIIFPLTAIIYLYYFVINKEHYISTIYILFISFLYDSLNNYIIGTTGVYFFLSLYIFQFHLKLFNFNKFSEVWLSFSIFTIEFSLIKLVVIYLSNDILINISYFIVTIISTIAFYPVGHNILRTLSKIYKPAYYDR